MKEILFRAWDNNSKQMITEGGFIKIDGSGNFEVFNEPNGSWDENGKEGSDLILMQFTGLLDKNGKKIFEGDVVEVFEMCVDGDDVEFKRNLIRHTVEWGGKSYPAFDLIPPIADDMNSFSYLDSTSELEMEIIGNIYDNPDLLKETNDQK